jgi:uncharacterized protein YndB with AHSA1/START domain
MAAQRIEREILIDAPVEVVWRVLTEPEHLQAWFSAAAELEPRPGAIGQVTFENRATSSRRQVQIQVETVEPPHRFSFRWVHPEGVAADERNSLLVEFSLVDEGERTRLRLVEGGFEHGELDGQLEDHREGWDACLPRLAEYAAGQAGVRVEP